MMIDCPDLILTADWHLREDQPICRTDNFMETQIRKSKFIYNLIKEIQDAHNYTPPVLSAGDLLHRWKSPPILLSNILRFVPQLITVAGNHELPAHNINRIEESGLFTLEKAGKVELLGDHDMIIAKKENMLIYGFPYLTPLSPIEEKDPKYYNVALIHHFVYKGRKPFPGATGRVTRVMQQLKGFDLIVSGDNHQPFAHYKDGQWLVNPGSLTRQRASETHKPRVYLWFAKKNRIEEVFIPIEEGVVSREHIEKEKKRNERIELYASKLTNKVDLKLNFKSNLKAYYGKNKVSKPVQSKISEAMDES